MSRAKTVVTSIVESERGKLIALVVTPASAVTVSLLRKHGLRVNGTIGMYVPLDAGRPANAMVVTDGLVLDQAAIDALYRAAAAEAHLAVPSDVRAVRADDEESGS